MLSASLRETVSPLAAADTAPTRARKTITDVICIFPALNQRLLMSLRKTQAKERQQPEQFEAVSVIGIAPSNLSKNRVDFIIQALDMQCGHATTTHPIAACVLLIQTVQH